MWRSECSRAALKALKVPFRDSLQVKNVKVSKEKNASKQAVATGVLLVPPGLQGLQATSERLEGRVWKCVDLAQPLLS